MVPIREVGPEERPFKRHGLGWQFSPPEAPVVLTFDRVNERGGDTWSEIHVTNGDGGHLCRRRVNLLGGSSLNGLVKELETLTDGRGWDWRRIVASGCESTLEAFRSGETTETFSGLLRRPPSVRWLCAGLVQHEVINCWLAAAGTGKSTFATTLAACHALGLPFLGRDVERGTPLYLDWESTSDAFSENLFFAAAGLGRSEVPPIHRIRMRGTLRSRVHQVAERVDRLRVTLLIVDAVAAAGGSPGDGSWEHIALELEETLQALPAGVTVLLLDHSTGAEFTSGAVAMKARGAQRKVEFIRNQWSLTLDREGGEDGRHVVGWTHSKINRGRLLPPFGVEIVHGEDEIRFRPLGREDVQPLAERIPFWKRIERQVTRYGAQEVKCIALELIGKDDKNSCAQVRVAVSRDNGRHLVRLPDGRIGAAGGVTSPPVQLVHGGEDELPF